MEGGDGSVTHCTSSTDTKAQPLGRRVSIRNPTMCHNLLDPLFIMLYRECYSGSSFPHVGSTRTSPYLNSLTLFNYFFTPPPAHKYSPWYYILEVSISHMSNDHKLCEKNESPPNTASSSLPTYTITTFSRFLCTYISWHIFFALCCLL